MLASHGIAFKEPRTVAILLSFVHYLLDLVDPIKYRGP